VLSVLVMLIRSTPQSDDDLHRVSAHMAQLSAYAARLANDQTGNA